MDPLFAIDKWADRGPKETFSPLDTRLYQEVQNDSSDVDNSTNTNDEGTGGNGETEIYMPVTQQPWTCEQSYMHATQDIQDEDHDSRSNRLKRQHVI